MSAAGVWVLGAERRQGPDRHGQSCGPLGTRLETTLDSSCWYGLNAAPTVPVREELRSRLLGKWRSFFFFIIFLCAVQTLILIPPHPAAPLSHRK